MTNENRIAILATAVAILFSPHASADAVRPPHAKVLQKDDTTILALKGSPYDQGYAYGYYAAEFISEGTEQLFAGRLDPQKYEKLICGRIVNNAILLPGWRAEIEAFYRAVVDRLGQPPYIKSLKRRMTVRDVIAVNTFGNWTGYLAKPRRRRPSAPTIGIDLIPLSAEHLGCSSLAVWGRLSRTGSTIVGRNMDYILLPVLLRRRLVVLRIPQPQSGKVPILTVSYPGHLGSPAGLSTRGLFVALHDAGDRVSDPLKAKFAPRTFVVRELLQTLPADNTAFEKAAELLKSQPALYGNNIIMATPSGAAVVEWGPSGVAIFRGATDQPVLFATNHYRMLKHGAGPSGHAEAAKPHPPHSVRERRDLARKGVGKARKRIRLRSTFARLKAMQDVILPKVRAGQKITRADIAEALKQASVGSTVHSVIVEPAKLELTVYWIRKRGQAAIRTGRPVTINLRQLLQRLARKR